MKKRLLLLFAGALLVAVAWFFFGLFRMASTGPTEFRSHWYEGLHNQVPAQGYFDLSAELQSKVDKELLDLSLSLPHYHLYPVEELRTLLASERKCLPIKTLPRSRDLLKLAQWQKFICDGIPLPEQFWLHPPFIHPSGESFAALAEKKGGFAKLSLQEPRQSYLTLIETLNEGTPFHKSLAKQMGALEKVIDGDAIVLAPPWVFVRSPGNEEPNQYSVYSQQEWEQHFKNEPFHFEPSGNSSLCLWDEGSGCWIPNSTFAKERLWALRAGAFLFLFVILGIGFIFYWKQRKLQKEEENRRKFTLQMLTHELRTPVASLLLLLESLRSKFDHLPEDAQKEVLKLMSEIQRLKRVVESSSAYLEFKDGPQQNKFESVSVIPLAERLQSLHAIPVLYQEPHLQVWSSPALIEFCLSNLLTNALRHGKPPYQFRIYSLGADVIFEIQDQGNLKEVELETLTQPFFKNQRSHGLGLGLSLVKEISETQGWHFALNLQPTRFSIRVPKGSPS